MAKVVRIEKNRNYTVMSNYHLRDKSLSLKAKGLLSIMLSLPDDWDYSNRGLAGIVKEGVSAVGSGLRELEAAGYIKRTKLRDAQGKITDVEYVIYEQPHKEKTTETEQATETEEAEPEPASENSDFFAPEENSYANEPHIENKDVVPADMENREQLNTNKTNTKKLNTDCNKYQSTNNTEPEEKTKSALAMPVDWIDRYNKTMAAIKNQIDYDSLITTNDAELVNDIVSVMTEVMLVDTTCYTIEGKKIPAELVRINYGKITYGRLDTFLLDFSRLDSKINNPKNYLITALYNIASTAETSITNRVNHDMYGGM
ncbi:MAG: DUF6017 domain-containing protein [bacterium]|nr:DUF6017 domain-containing protein [bacterium]